MNVKLILSALAVCLAAGGVAAQEAHSNSYSASGSQSASQSQSGSVAGATIIQNAPSNTYGELKTVPSVAAPGIITANVCGMGMSGGISALGGGVSFGNTTIDESCETIQQAAALNTLLGADVAVYHLAANVPELCRTLRATGHIPSSSDCGDRVATRLSTSGSTSAPVTSPRPQARPEAGYSKCEKTAAGTVTIRYKGGADKATAKARCLASLGY